METTRSEGKDDTWSNYGDASKEECVALRPESSVILGSVPGPP